MDNTNKIDFFIGFLKEISRKICRNQKKVLPCPANDKSRFVKVGAIAQLVEQKDWKTCVPVSDSWWYHFFMRLNLRNRIQSFLCPNNTFLHLCKRLRMKKCARMFYNSYFFTTFCIVKFKKTN